MQTSDNYTGIGPDGLPMTDASEKIDEKPVEQKLIQQGQGSSLNSDMVDGFQVSTAVAPTPNTLVPLDQNGQFPASTIPAAGLSSSNLFAFLMAPEIL